MKKSVLLTFVAIFTIKVWGQTNIFPTTGNVGIGTISPTSNLHISASSNPQFQLRSQSTGTRGFWITVSDENEIVSLASSYGTLGTYPIVFKLGLQEKVRIASNGNVGIGTATPIDNLEVSSTTGGVLRLGNSNQTVSAGSIAGKINFYKADSSYNSGIVSYIQSRAIDLGGSYSLDFATGDPGGGSNAIKTRMTINYNGKVGIGTTSPSYKLQVHGSVLFKDESSVNGFYFAGETGANRYLNIYDDSGSSKIILRPEGNTYFNGGNVGIGTDVIPYKLSVAGTIGCEEIIVEDVSSWADFVFEEDYKLMSLKELDNYIKENKHLPEIPTTKEVEENGISVGEMNAKLLQKIEELTLYTIQQQYKINSQQELIEGLLERVERLENK